MKMSVLMRSPSNVLFEVVPNKLSARHVVIKLKSNNNQATINRLLSVEVGLIKAPVISIRRVRLNSNLSFLKFELYNVLSVVFGVDQTRTYLGDPAF